MPNYLPSHSFEADAPVSFLKEFALCQNLFAYNGDLQVSLIKLGVGGMIVTDYVSRVLVP
jgi:hypothetical protein